MKTPIPCIVFGFVLAVSSTTLGQGILVTHIDGDNGINLSGNAYTAATDPMRDEYAPLVDATTFDLFVDTPGDILLIDFQMDLHAGSIWQEPDNRGYGVNLNSNNRPPDPAAFSNWPALAADTWLTTPGSTAVADDAPFLGPAQATHFDTDQNGAQTDFQFARITLVGDYEAQFTGSIQVASSPRPITQPFSFAMFKVPEPSGLGMLLTALLVGSATMRRSSLRSKYQMTIVK